MEAAGDCAADRPGNAISRQRARGIRRLLRNHAAKRAIVSWQTKAAGTAVKKIAESQVGKAVVNAAKTLATEKMVKSVAERGISQFGNARRTRAEQNAQRDKALRVARQVHGHLTYSYLDETDDDHWIVWKDDRPFRAFPKVDGDLATREELAHVEAADLRSPDEVEADARRWARKRRAAGQLENEEQSTAKTSPDA